MFVREHGGFTDPDQDALDGVAAEGSDPSLEMVIWSEVGVPDAHAGELVARAARSAGYDEPDVEGEAKSGKRYFTRSMHADVDALAAAADELFGIAMPHGGWYIGWNTWCNAGFDQEDDENDGDVT